MQDNAVAGRIKRRATFFSYKLAYILTSQIPLSVGPVIAKITGTVAYLVSRRKRKIIRNNLQPVFGTSGEVSQKLVLQSFVSYAQFWFESFKLGSISRDVVRSHGHQDGLDYLYDAIVDGRGAIAVAPHLGSWDFGAAWFDESRATVTAVVEALDPPELFEWFLKLRSGFGLNAIAHNDNPLPKLINAIRNNEAVVLVADRSLDAATVEVEFFSRKVNFPLGPAILALRTNAPLLPITAFMEPKGQHFIKVLPEIEIGERKGLREDAARVTQEIAKSFETLIRMAPEQWHVFSPFFDV